MEEKHTKLVIYYSFQPKKKRNEKTKAKITLVNQLIDIFIKFWSLNM